MELQERIQLAPLRIVILGLFVILFLGSVYFNIERILFADPAYVLFRIINLGSLQISEHRYGSFITQLFPLIASKLHLPLSWIVLIYSASFNLFYLVVAAFLVLRWKDYPLATLMSFYFVLFVSDSYFWVINEVHQGIAWMFLCFGAMHHLYLKNRSKVIIPVVFSVLAWLSIYSHPLIIFPFWFLLLFFLLDKKIGSWNAPFNIILCAILLVLCVSRVVISLKVDQYDSSKLHPLTSFGALNIWRAVTSPTVKEILRRSLTNYWVVPLLLVWGMIALVRKRKYKLATLTITFCIAYFVCVFLTLADFLAFYTETQLAPGTVMITAPFVFYVFPDLKSKTAAFLLGFIFIVRLVYIGIASDKFVSRKQWLYSVLKDMRQRNITKGIIYAEIRTQVLSVWAIPEESLIASAIENDKPNLTFVVGSVKSISKIKADNRSQMISSYEAWDIDSTNRRYFDFDTTTNYQSIQLPMMRK